MQIPRYHYGYRLCWCNSCLPPCLPYLGGIQRQIRDLFRSRYGALNLHSRSPPSSWMTSMILVAALQWISCHLTFCPYCIMSTFHHARLNFGLFSSWQSSIWPTLAYCSNRRDFQLGLRPRVEIEIIDRPVQTRYSPPTQFKIQFSFLILYPTSSSIIHYPSFITVTCQWSIVSCYLPTKTSPNPIVTLYSWLLSSRRTILSNNIKQTRGTSLINKDLTFSRGKE